MAIADPLTTSSPVPPRPFETVLVANRGEIACRIIATLAKLGIRSVAVYSDADRGAKHVGMADVAVRIGPAAARHSYLNAAAIIDAARRTGAQAVHPGYGFLAENARFASACAAAGLVFIGPPVRAIEIMGDKIRARKQVESFGVATIPGVAEPGLDDAALTAAARDVGYPLIIKPSAGGGGTGMQVVREPGELGDALAAARRLAASAFGDDTLFLERLVAEPRHIEVQVLADDNGVVVHLGERECSLQRRHQKVIEEAPSPLLDAETRARIGEAACRVARSVDYRGAGTVEFLVAAAAPGDFFFMEMNTRLQVEHPVTELVTGIDLVAWQLRIAAGRPLTIAQTDVRLAGHAIEARVYAESPERGFLPATGTVLALSEAAGDGIRVDSALVAGLGIGADYDPMLAKVIAYGADRAQAMTRLDAALANTTVLGVQTNIEYLRALLADADVRAGRLQTGLIEQRLPGLAFRQPDDEMLAAAALLLHADRQADAGPGLWHRPSGWRLGAARPVGYGLRVSGGRIVEVSVGASPGEASASMFETPDAASPAAVHVTVDGRSHRARLERVAGGSRVRLEFDGIGRTLQLARQGASVWIGDGGAAFELVVVDRAEHLAERRAATARGGGLASPDVRTPMPGTVATVDVATGESVKAGQSLLTVEAMKMEHRLTATIAGTVTIAVVPGELVKNGQIVATIVPVGTPENAAGTPDPTAADPTAPGPTAPGPTRSATTEEGASS